jgi:hypothetical protein
MPTRNKLLALILQHQWFMKKSLKYSYPILFGVILFSIFLQFYIQEAYPRDTTATTKCWLLFIIVFCSAIILFTLPSFKKGGADETRSAIYPTLVIIGSAVMIFIIPAYMMYNSSFFGLSNDMLPLTATLSVVVWLGFLRKEVKSIPSKIFYAILTGVTTYVFLYHIAGILWYWHFFGR